MEISLILPLSCCLCAVCPLLEGRQSGQFPNSDAPLKLAFHIAFHVLILVRKKQCSFKLSVV